MNAALRFTWPGLVLLLVAFGSNGCRTPPTLEASEAALVDLIAQRLEIGREVAWTKFNSGAAILDAPREQAVLASLVSQARRAGVNPERATVFFNAQILASRQIQSELIAGWHGGAPKPKTTPVDLVTVIRPQLDAIGEKMVAALAGQRPAAPRSRSPRVQAALQARGFSAAVARLASQGFDSATP